MALKKSELYSSLWSSCDELRGGMDASQYTDYVLVLLFIKYVSDKYAGQPYAPITIPPGASFKDMVALKGKTDIGEYNRQEDQTGPDAGTADGQDPPDMNGRDQPTCWIIAGPNGVGKTTFALKYLPEAGCQNFVNADLIAAGMSPLAPERERMSAGRLFLSEIQRHIQARHDFGFETTLAGRGYLRLIRRLKATGWRVELIYLALPTPKWRSCASPSA